MMGRWLLLKKKEQKRIPSVDVEEIEGEEEWEGMKGVEGGKTMLSQKGVMDVPKTQRNDKEIRREG